MLVHRRSRRAGLATRLMQTMRMSRTAHGFRLLTLDTKRGGTAAHLYRQLGWTEAGVIPGFAFDPDGIKAHDAVLFYKELSQTDESRAGEQGRAGDARKRCVTRASVVSGGSLHEASVNCPNSTNGCIAMRAAVIRKKTLIIDDLLPPEAWPRRSYCQDISLRYLWDHISSNGEISASRIERATRIIRVGVRSRSSRKW